MMRLNAMLAAGLAALGFVVAAGAEPAPQITRGKEVSVRRTDVRTSNYSNVGGNPRGTPVKSWSDAVSYMNAPGFVSDVDTLLVQGVPNSFRPSYAKLAAELHRLARLAQEHNFMGRCGICRGACSAEAELAQKMQRVQLDPGTVLLSVTEGRIAKVRINRRLTDTRETYYTYRVKAEAVIKEFANPQLRKTDTVWACTYFYLMVPCRNAALGEVRVREMICITPKIPVFVPPPAPPVRPQLVEVESSSKSSATASAKASSSSTSRAEAEGGSAVVNNYTPTPPLAYVRPPESTASVTTMRVGGATIQGVPVMKQHQSQQQQQWQKQQQEQYQQQMAELINNIQNLIDIAIANGG